MTTKQELEQLRAIVKSLAASVVAHDDQIEGLINTTKNLARAAERNSKQIAAMSRQWQAYLNRLPPN